MNVSNEKITKKYLDFIKEHVEDVIQGKVERFYLLCEISDKLAISHKHLINIVNQIKGNHPCHFYDLQIIDSAKSLLKDETLTIREIAEILTYDPSNFSKFFKKWTGVTPGRYRKSKRK